MHHLHGGLENAKYFSLNWLAYWSQASENKAVRKIQTKDFESCLNSTLLCQIFLSLAYDALKKNASLSKAKFLDKKMDFSIRNCLLAAEQEPSMLELLQNFEKRRNSNAYAIIFGGAFQSTGLLEYFKYSGEDNLEMIDCLSRDLVNHLDKYRSGVFKYLAFYADPYFHLNILLAYLSSNGVSIDKRLKEIVLFDLCFANFIKLVQSLRAGHMAEGSYMFDIEIKGYICSRDIGYFDEGLLEGVSRDIKAFNLGESICDEVIRITVDDWKSRFGVIKQSRPEDMDFGRTPAFFTNHQGVMFIFPASWANNWMYYRLEQKWKRGHYGNFFGEAFELAAPNLIDISDGVWDWWIKLPKKWVYSKDGEHKELEIDLAVYSGELLIILELKAAGGWIPSSTENVARDWKRACEFLEQADRQARDLAQDYIHIDLELPKGIRYILPIVMVLKPVFAQQGSAYDLYKNKKDAIVPRWVTLEDCVEMLKTQTPESIMTERLLPYMYKVA